MSLAEAHQALVRLCQAGAFADAVKAAEPLVDTHPNQPALWLLLGCARADLGLLSEAESALRQSVALAPLEPATQFNCACVLQRLRKLSDAVAHYKAALQLNPRYLEAWNNLGTAQRDLGQTAQAIEAFSAALLIDASYLDARLNLAVTYEREGQLDRALIECEAVLAAQPDHMLATALMLRSKRAVCDFSAAGQFELVKDRLGLDGTPVPPFFTLSLEDNPERQLRRTKAWVETSFAHIIPAKCPARPTKRLRIGYFSANFRDHPNMVLTSGLFRSHDLARVNPIAFATTTHQHDAWTEVVKQGTSAFIEVGDASDADAAAQARAQTLDVAIDLDGYTRNARLALFAHRVAPVQVSFLGFPGSSGAPFFDYLVADQTVIPPSQRVHHCEALMYMPNAYQPNDDQRAIAKPEDCRTDHGLPDAAFVLCCFNASYKIGVAEFTIWMNILRASETAVLWLYKSNDRMGANLRRAAELQGVSGDRLIFAEHLPHSEHLARHRHADLFVDTFNCNAHTTMSDALWAGLPCVTLAGRQFAARVAASLLEAFGRPEQIAETPEAYEEIILDLVSNPGKCARQKAEFRKARAASALFDTAAFTAHFEEALLKAHDRALTGLPPEDLYTP